MATETADPTVTVHIPTPLRSYVDGQDEVEVRGETVAAALEALTEAYPDLRSHLYNEEDELRQFVNVYVEDEDIRYLDETETALEDGQELSIIPSIAGGRHTHSLH